MMPNDQQGVKLPVPSKTSVVIPKTGRQNVIAVKTGEKSPASATFTVKGLCS